MKSFMLLPVTLFSVSLLAAEVETIKPSFIIPLAGDQTFKKDIALTVELPQSELGKPFEKYFRLTRNQKTFLAELHGNCLKYTPGKSNKSRTKVETCGNSVAHGCVQDAETDQTIVERVSFKTSEMTGRLKVFYQCDGQSALVATAYPRRGQRGSHGKL